MTNLTRAEDAAKPAEAASGEAGSGRDASSTGSGASRQPEAHPPLGQAAVEISKLLVEVLQVGHVGRRSAGETGTVGDAGTGFSAQASGVGGVVGGPLSSHVIRAAIHIYGNGPQTIGQLASGLGVSQGWASRVVDEMERAGYVARERDPDDRRVVRVSLVPAAVERVEKAYRWRGDAVEAALEGLSPSERAAVRRFLRRFVDEVRASAG